MPFDRRLYPANWKQISAQIRTRAENRCECRGECGVEHGGGYHGRCGRKNGALISRGGGRQTKIVLTVAHLNHKPMDCRRTNLRAMCQACHLRYDQEHHKKNAAATRRRKKIDAGQLELLEQNHN